MSRSRVVQAALFGLLTLVVVVAVVWAARRSRQDPARCAGGFVARGARCCPLGQELVASACAGTIPECPPGMRPATVGSGCVVENRKISIAGGYLDLSPTDWEAVGRVEARQVSVAQFWIDSTEVTQARWGECVGRGACNAIALSEPGLPVTNVSAKEAERFCRFEHGELPTGDQWLFAAAGDTSRRYPWGQTGLVCRRAAFGLVDGPCAHGAVSADLAGTRPDGATPDGVLDMSGNVAEWTREPDGSFRARGGSFRSRLAGQLESTSAEAFAPDASALDVGFRCAYSK